MPRPELRLRFRAVLLTGDEVGVGSDGEPLLANIREIADLRFLDDGWLEIA
jgi:hypothetical protein